jgi:hypothetical protein
MPWRPGSVNLRRVGETREKESASSFTGIFRSEEIIRPFVQGFSFHVAGIM